VLRQQIKPDQRIQVVILKGGEAPNIITPMSELSLNVRARRLKKRECCSRGCGTVSRARLWLRDAVWSLTSSFKIILLLREEEY